MRSCLWLYDIAIPCVADQQTGWHAVFNSDYGPDGITWVANANLALTNQFGLTLSTNEFDGTANTVGSTGRMTWANAMAWITGMNNVNYLGFNDWCMPFTQQPDASCSTQSSGGFGLGLDCTGSEIFYAWAVHAGDVTATVPKPGTLVLLGTALAGLLGFGRRKRRL